MEKSEDKLLAIFLIEILFKLKTDIIKFYYFNNNKTMLGRLLIRTKRLCKINLN